MDSSSPSPSDYNGEPAQEDELIELVQSILLSNDRDKIQTLENKLAELDQQAQKRIDSLEQEAQRLESEIQRMLSKAHEDQLRIRQLQIEIDILRHQSRADSEGLVARLSPVLSDLMGRKIRDSRDEMAEALGPVMGEAIRVQIRDSRQDMIEALYPVIGSTVQRAVAEAFNEFRRNLDRRIRQGTWRNVYARWRGIDPAELAMRDALPFEIQQVFLIQQWSGLLLAHVHREDGADYTDSDLIGGMLTAIRDFVQDSFGKQDDDGEGLSEIQYAKRRIIIQTGRTAYLAVVLSGVEPEGFHARIRDLVSELHVSFEPSLKSYNGDPTTLPHLEPHMSRLLQDSHTAVPPTSLSRGQRLFVWLSGILLIGLLGLSCFYLQFTINLYPLAFPSSTPTNTATATQTATPTNTATA
ncbi:MAG: hypothetical protein KDE51_12735, partial [Anaerolineales bacterium]|nr:hypothetical protein [Anaerolineales bacterium]